MLDSRRLHRRGGGRLGGIEEAAGANLRGARLPVERIARVGNHGSDLPRQCRHPLAFRSPAQQHQERTRKGRSAAQNDDLRQSDEDEGVDQHCCSAFTASHDRYHEKRQHRDPRHKPEIPPDAGHDVNGQDHQGERHQEPPPWRVVRQPRLLPEPARHHKYGDREIEERILERLHRPENHCRCEAERRQRDERGHAQAAARPTDPHDRGARAEIREEVQQGADGSDEAEEDQEERKRLQKGRRRQGLVDQYHAAPSLPDHGAGEKEVHPTVDRQQPESVSGLQSARDG